MNEIEVILAEPRGFCAGVERAVAIVEKAIEKYGAPVYVRHEIVHNKYVVENLRSKGAIFVEEVDEIPNGAIAIFSAHGVAEKVEIDAEKGGLNVIDATCPLVKKVHNQAVKYENSGNEIILIGHNGHPEVEGTSGRVKGEVLLVENISDAKSLKVKDPHRLSYVTQTTLSVDDTRDIIAILRKRFPDIKGPGVNDICYATQNRQDAVKEIVKIVDLLLVIGASNSSNSNRLCDIGKENNIASYLITGSQDVDLLWLKDVKKIGITAGASAPEILVKELVEFLEKNANVKITLWQGKKENIIFNIPPKLR